VVYVIKSLHAAAVSHGSAARRFGLDNGLRDAAGATSPNPEAIQDKSDQEGAHHARDRVAAPKIHHERERYDGRSNAVDCEGDPSAFDVSESRHRDQADKKAHEDRHGVEENEFLIASASREDDEGGGTKKNANRQVRGVV
jgi:hypothetical protein